MSNLLIVESPNKAKKIASFLGSDWQVIATAGHIRDLPVDELGVDIHNNFKPQYVINPNSKKTVNRLKQALAKSNSIYLGLDADREGEAIAYHVRVVLGLESDTKRVVYQEITEQAIKQALAKPKTLNMRLVAAQEVRRILDRLVGYLVSPELSKAGNAKLSAGRVQSVALRLIVERDTEIEQFEPEPYLKLQLSHLSEETAWKSAWNTAEYAEEGELFNDIELLEKIKSAAEDGVVVDSIEQKETLSHPPSPFITSTLQQVAYRRLGLRNDETMLQAQKLYEAGLITYHRTDSPVLSEEAIDNIRQWLSAQGFELPNTVRQKKASKNAQEAHEAIRPTNVTQTSIDGEGSALYALIWQRTVSALMLPEKAKVTTVTLKAKQKIAEIVPTFTARGKQIINLGYKKLSGEEIADTLLPPLQTEQEVGVIDAAIKQTETKPPKNFDAASLTKELEENQIGRPATYASIIKNLITRKYITAQKGIFVSTPLGKQVVSVLIDQFSFAEIDFTKKVEKQLDAIAEGTAKAVSALSDFYGVLNTELAEADFGAISSVQDTTNTKGQVTPLHSHKCPACDEGALMQKQGKYGVFWGCKNYPTCNYKARDDNGKPQANYPKMQEGASCPACKKGIVVNRVHKTKKQQYRGCSRYPECNFFQWAEAVVTSTPAQLAKEPESTRAETQKTNQTPVVNNDDAIWHFPIKTLLSQANTLVRTEDNQLVTETGEALKRAFLGMRLPAPDFLFMRLTPNAVMVRVKGSADITIKKIATKKEEFLTTYSIKILSIMPALGGITLLVARAERQILPLISAWKERESNRSEWGLDLSLLIGFKEDDGKPCYLNLAKAFNDQSKAAPHTLVAGTTGSGKSVVIQNFLLELCALNSPNHLQIYVIDPKQGVDFWWFNPPHLQGDIIVEQEAALALIAQLCDQMNKRYRIFRQHKVKDIHAYNMLSNVESMPVLVLVHDEFTDWMLDKEYAKSVTAGISSLGVKARAAGIHLIFSTQRPDKDSMPMQLRDNLGNRLILRMAARATSEIALGQSGAESLLGQGHMLAKLEGELDPILLQVPYLDDEGLEQTINLIQESAK